MDQIDHIALLISKPGLHLGTGRCSWWSHILKRRAWALVLAAVQLAGVSMLVLFVYWKVYVNRLPYFYIIPGFSRFCLEELFIQYTSYQFLCHFFPYDMFITIWCVYLWLQHHDTTVCTPRSWRANMKAFPSQSALLPTRRFLSMCFKSVPML